LHAWRFVTGITSILIERPPQKEKAAEAAFSTSRQEYYFFWRSFRIVASWAASMDSSASTDATSSLSWVFVRASSARLIA
jgi:hypothetical protein